MLPTKPANLRAKALSGPAAVLLTAAQATISIVKKDLAPEIFGIAAGQSLKLGLAALLGLLVYMLLKHSSWPTQVKVALGALFVLIVGFFQGSEAFKADASDPPAFRVQANLGWQDTKIRLAKAETTLSIRVDGRISLAINQQYHLAELLKHLVLRGKGQAPRAKGTKYQADPAWGQENRYILTSWMDPIGEAIPNDPILDDELKMLPNRNWGIVICAVHSGPPPPTVEHEDPWSEITWPSAPAIVAIGAKSGDYKFTGTGSLLCMINDGVISRTSPYRGSRESFDALDKESVRVHDDIHKFSSEDIPRILLNDNAGEFALTIQGVKGF